jgi:hypothetical protein
MISAEIWIQRPGEPIRFETREDPFEACSLGKASMGKGTNVSIAFYQNGELVISWESKNGADWKKKRHPISSIPNQP